MSSKKQHQTAVKAPVVLDDSDVDSVAGGRTGQLLDHTVTEIRPPRTTPPGQFIDHTVT